MNPANAILNYLYRLAEVECSLMLSLFGLDPGMGIWHADVANRDSFALDVIEAVRPQVDRHVLQMLRTRTFLKSDFHETAEGVCRVVPPLTHELAEAIPMIRSWITSFAEEVAVTIGDSADRVVRISQVGTKPSARPRRRPSACRMCGGALVNARRAVCDACLPAYDIERSRKLSSAGKATLAAMRASPHNPAKSPEARARQAERSREAMLANRAWEREHGRVFDVQQYEGEVLPRLREMSVAALVHATGLSGYYLWRIKKGERRLHPRHWQSVLSPS